MTALATDNFTRANSTGLGSNWTQGSGEGTTIDVVSNAAQVNSAGSDSAYYYSGASPSSWPNDQYSKCTLSYVGGATSGGDEGGSPMVRHTTAAARTYYRGAMDHAGSGNVSLSKFVGGTYTNITSATKTWTNGDTWELDAQSTTLKLIHVTSATTVITSTDSSIGSGNPGLAYSSSELSAAIFDNWEGGDFSSGATTAYKDATTRVRVAARTFKDALARVRVAVRSFKDATLRIRVGQTSFRDAAVRLRVAATTFRDASVRVRVIPATVYRDAAARVRVAVTSFRDAAVRVRVSRTAFRDSVLRVRIAQAALRDATMRVRVATPVGSAWRDTTTRVGVAQSATRDATLRLYVAIRGFRDASLRARVAATALRDAAVRVRAAALSFRDATVRISVQAAGQGFRFAAVRARVATTARRDATLRLRVGIKIGRLAAVANALVNGVSTERKLGIISGRVFTLSGGESVAFSGGVVTIDGHLYAIVYARSTVIALPIFVENWKECESDLTLATRVVWPTAGSGVELAPSGFVPILQNCDIPDGALKPWEI